MSFMVSYFLATEEKTPPTRCQLGFWGNKPISSFCETGIVRNPKWVVSSVSAGLVELFLDVVRRILVRGRARGSSRRRTFMMVDESQFSKW